MIDSPDRVDLYPYSYPPIYATRVSHSPNQIYYDWPQNYFTQVNYTNFGNLTAATGFPLSFEYDFNQDGTVDETVTVNTSNSPLLAADPGVMRGFGASRSLDIPVGTHRVRTVIPGVTNETVTSNNTSAWSTFTVAARPPFDHDYVPFMVGRVCCDALGLQTHEFAYQVSNVGTAATTTYMTRQFEIDYNRDGTIDHTFSAVADATISAGGSSGELRASTSVSIPAGAHRIRVTIPQRPGETNVSNNTSAWFDFTNALPDLVAGPVVIAAEQPTGFAQRRFIATTTNTGAQSSNTYTLYFDFRTISGGATIATRTVPSRPAIAASSTALYDAVQMFSISATGTYEVRSRVVENGVSLDPNLTNNVSAWTPFTVVAPYADMYINEPLTFDGAAPGSNTYEVGIPITAAYRIKNDGTGQAGSAPVGIRLRLTDGSGTFLKNWLQMSSLSNLAAQPVGSPSGGGSISMNAGMDFIDIGPGTYQVQLQINNYTVVNNDAKVELGSDIDTPVGNDYGPVYTFTVLPSGTTGGSPSYECSDGIDNDGDGLSDQADPDCHTDMDATTIAGYFGNDDDESGPPPSITTFTASTPVAYGGSATVNWDSTYASYCQASGAWSGNVGITGVDVSSGPLFANPSYLRLRCFNSEDESSLEQVDVVVEPLTLGATTLCAGGGEIVEDRVISRRGDTVTLSWVNMDDVGQCTLEGAGIISGGTAAGGCGVNTATVQAESRSTYNLRCDNYPDPLPISDEADVLILPTFREV